MPEQTEVEQLRAENAVLWRTVRKCADALITISPVEGDDYGIYSGDPILIQEAWEAVDDPRLPRNRG